MIMQDAVTSYLMSLSKFVTKKGSSLDARRELVAAINTLTEEDSLAAIYVNDTDSINVPDVSVIHLYDNGFAKHMLCPDTTILCPYGYTIEISSRCFTKYTEEELGAVIIHDVLQNVMSDTAKIRFLKAYTEALNKHSNAQIMDLFDHVNLDEVLFIAFLEICLRPFKAPAHKTGYVATDDVLDAMGLGDAYDSYLKKALPISNHTPEEEIEMEFAKDLRDVNTIIQSCMDNDIRHYYAVIRTSIPLITLKNILGNKHGSESLGFTVQRKEIRRRHPVDGEAKIIQESFNDPTTDYDIRFQIDKIIGNMRYAESEAEREVILFKIKQLSIKLEKQKMKASRRMDSNSERVKRYDAYLAELEELRKKLVSMEIKKKRWSVYMKEDMPAGYDF